MMSMSLPQMPQAPTRTSTSSLAGFGSWMLASSNLCGALTMNALTVSLVRMLALPLQQPVRNEAGLFHHRCFQLAVLFALIQRRDTAAHFRQTRQRMFRLDAKHCVAA